MSSCDRRAALAGLGALALSGCGFQPLYGEGAGGAALFGEVAVERGSGRLDFLYRRELRRRLGEPDADPAFRLATSIALVERGLGISQADDITRINVRGTASYRLIDAATGAVAASGSVGSIGAYNATAEAYATRVAKEDAEERVVSDLAVRVASQVAAAVDRDREAG